MFIQLGLWKELSVYANLKLVMPLEQKELKPESAGALERVSEALEERTPVEAAERAEKSAMPAASAAAPKVEAPRASVVKSPLRQDIEAALEESLGEIFAALPPAKQAAFGEQGEKLAARLEAMIAGGKFDARRAHQDVVDWLNLIPHTNPFFLIQEAKVKTDALQVCTRGSTPS